MATKKRKVKRRVKKRTKKQKRESALKGWATRQRKKRSEAAKLGWARIREREAAERRSESRKKGWVTRRLNKAHKEAKRIKRSEAAKLGWRRIKEREETERRKEEKLPPLPPRPVDPEEIIRSVLDRARDKFQSADIDATSRTKRNPDATVDGELIVYLTGEEDESSLIYYEDFVDWPYGLLGTDVSVGIASAPNPNWTRADWKRYENLKGMALSMAPARPIIHVALVALVAREIWKNHKKVGLEPSAWVVRLYYRPQLPVPF